MTKYLTGQPFSYGYSRKYSENFEAIFRPRKDKKKMAKKSRNENKAKQESVQQKG